MRTTIALQALGGVLWVGGLLAGWAACPSAHAAETDTVQPAAERPEAPEEPDAQPVVLSIAGWERLHDRLEAWRERHPVRLGVGAEHWVNVNRESGKATYGYPGSEGTYLWWITADLEAPLSTAAGCERMFGAHLDVEWRERTKFAEWYEGRLWLQEGYLFADVLGGRLKAGTVLNALGLASDGTWWNSLPYYDGLMQDTDWGLSFERTLVERPRFTLAATGQLFLAENHVGGALAGADAESDDTRDEGPAGVLRLAPTWTGRSTSLALGLSGTVGRIDGREGVADETFSAGALDATFSWKGLTLMGAVYVADGVRNETHYITGLPTRRLTDVVLAATWRIGPFTPHVCWSGGWVKEPGGHQESLIVGTDVALLRKVNLYLEYVKWTSKADDADEVLQEDGFQLILGWEF